MITQVTVTDVWKSFDGGRIEVLKGVSLEVRQGEVIALCGTSGCGKSTLLNVISGLEEVDRGLVRVAGRDVVEESTRPGLPRHSNPPRSSLREAASNRDGSGCVNWRRPPV